MCVKFYFRDLNPDLYLSHPTSTCIYEVTIAWWSVQLTFQGKIQIWSWSKLLWLMFDGSGSPPVWNPHVSSCFYLDE